MAAWIALLRAVNVGGTGKLPMSELKTMCEDLGFAAKGKAGTAFRDGEFKADGRIPINTHGGLLSHGYPGRAAGIGNLIEAVMQLRGDAGNRQIPNARMTMTHGMGGLFATHGVLLLEAT